MRNVTSMASKLRGRSQWNQILPSLRWLVQHQSSNAAILHLGTLTRGSIVRRITNDTSIIKHQSQSYQFIHSTAFGRSKCDTVTVSQSSKVLRAMLLPYRIHSKACFSEVAFAKYEIPGSSSVKTLVDMGRTMRVVSGSLVSVGEEATLRSSAIWKSMWGHWIGKSWVPHLPPFVRIVGASTWVCARSQVVPRLLAVLVGEATWGRGGGGRHVAIAEAYSPTSMRVPKKGLDVIIAAILPSLEFIILCCRAIYLIFLFTPAIVSGPFADMMGGRYRKRWLKLVHHSLETAGAAFIKWGQWAATRPDLFPKDMCQELSQLHTQAPSHSYEVTRKMVEGAFGRKIAEIFDDFEEEPVASGSIAQVHRASLKQRYPGVASKPQLVAVKVRHPGVSEVIRRDFVIINWMARLSTMIPATRWLRLEDSVQQFATFMMTQVDLAREAAHLSRFIYNFRRWKDVSFPKPVYPLVHPAVLVETFEQGESVSRYVERPERDHINTQLAHLGSHTLLKMLLVDNFIHADLHPGNILVRVQRQRNRPGRVLRGHPHVILLDVGMTAELTPRDRITMLEFFKAIASRDATKTAECTLQFTRNQSCPDPAAFVAAVQESFKEWTEKGDKIPTGDCIQELLEQIRRHRVNIDGDVCTVMITTLVLEGWQRKLDPNLSVMDTLHSILFKSDWAADLAYTIDSIMCP